MAMGLSSRSNAEANLRRLRRCAVGTTGWTCSRGNRHFRLGSRATELRWSRDVRLSPVSDRIAASQRGASGAYPDGATLTLCSTGSLAKFATMRRAS